MTSNITINYQGIRFEVDYVEHKADRYAEPPEPGGVEVTCIMIEDGEITDLLIQEAITGIESMIWSELQ